MPRDPWQGVQRYVTGGQNIYAIDSLEIYVLGGILWFEIRTYSEPKKIDRLDYQKSQVFFQFVRDGFHVSVRAGEVRVVLDTPIGTSWEKPKGCRIEVLGVERRVRGSAMGLLIQNLQSELDNCILSDVMDS